MAVQPCMEWDLIKKIDQSEHSFFKVWKWIFMHVVRHPYKQHFVFFPFFNLGKFVSSLNWKVCTSNPNDALDQTFGPNLFTMPMLNFIWNNLDEWNYVLLVVQIWPWVGQITDEKVSCVIRHVPPCTKWCKNGWFENNFISRMIWVTKLIF